MLSQNSSKLNYTYPTDANGGSADLGLFSQLLQMVDGDWSDSIHAICSHIHNHFSALGVSLSIYDKIYNEFIYVSYSLNANKALKEVGIDVNVNTAVNILSDIYINNTSILEEKIFTGSELRELVTNYFNNDQNKVERIFNDLNLKAIAAFPVLESNGTYTCFFHVLSDRDINDSEKNKLNEYVPQLNVALEIVFLVRKLFLKATHDGLTKLFNHKQGEILLTREIDRVSRNRDCLTVCMLDIDDFKKVNDMYGHKAGDMVLEFLGDFLTKKMRKSDIISRYGGEEFLLVLTETGMETACRVLRRLKTLIRDHVFTFDGEEFSITASFGVVEYDPEVHVSLDNLVKTADEMLYRAKRNGKNRIECA
ncbi:MAG TPA: GGDEF domain-containing protein [Spirochaetota bacterium]|nr:GGDEF domain-containing protein [Spirochaetota bacterium]